MLAVVPTLLHVRSGPALAAEESVDRMLGIVSQPFNISAVTEGRFTMKVSSRIASTRSGRIEFRLHRRVSGREPFRAIAAGQVQSAVIDSVSIPLTRATRTTAGLINVVVRFRTGSDSAYSLAVRFPGVYPVSIRITNAAGNELASTMTFVHRTGQSEPGPQIPFGVLARLAPPPSLRPDGLVEISESARTSIRRFISFLESAPDNVAVCVQPEVIAALGASVEPVDEALFAELRTQLGRRTLTAATFAPADPSLLAARGLANEFLAQMRLGDQVFNRLMPEVNIQRSTWVALDRLDGRGLDLLRRAGIKTVVLMAGAQSGLASGKPINLVSAIREPEREAMPVVGIDPFIAGQLSMPNLFPEQIGYRVAAEALVIRDDLLGTGVDPSKVRIAISSPTGLLYDESSLLVASRLLGATPGFTGTNIAATETAAEADPPVVLPSPPEIPRDTLTSSLKAAREELNAVLSMVADDDPQRDVWKHLLGISASTVADSPSTYVDALRESLGSMLGSISVTTPGAINLPSRNGTVRFQLRNDSSHDLTVRVRVSSAKLTIKKPSVDVTLSSGATTEINFSATTRTNGRFPVTVKVTTPDGNVNVAAPVTVTARVSALAGFGQLVSFALLLVLLAWWWSHRRSRASDNSPPAAALPPEGTVGSQ